MNNKSMAKSVEEARLKWLATSSKASELALEMYQPGSGYGDPQAEAGDKYRVEVAKSEADKFTINIMILIVNWQSRSLVNYKNLKL